MEDNLLQYKRRKVWDVLKLVDAESIPRMEELYGGMEDAEASHGFPKGECTKLYESLLKNPEKFRLPQQWMLSSCIYTGNLLNTIRFRERYTKVAADVLKESGADSKKLEYFEKRIEELDLLETEVMDAFVPKSKGDREAWSKKISKICNEIDGVLNSYVRGY